MSSTATLAALAKSITRFGQLQPAIANAAGDILDGNLRVEASRLAGVEPWVVQRNLPPEARFQFLIRREVSPLEMADLAAYLREETSPSGARRAPGSGRTKDVVAQQFAEQFGHKVSPREAAYALALANASADERAAVERVSPVSMRAAHKALGDHRLGSGTEDSSPEPETRIDLLKRANEFRAAVIRHHAPINAADRAVLLQLRVVIDQLLDTGGAHAPPE